MNWCNIPAHLFQTQKARKNRADLQEKRYMSEITREQIEEAIKGYIEPHMEKDLVSTKAVKDIEINGDKI